MGASSNSKQHGGIRSTGNQCIVSFRITFDARAWSHKYTAVRAHPCQCDYCELFIHALSRTNCSAGWTVSPHYVHALHFCFWKSQISSQIQIPHWHATRTCSGCAQSGKYQRNGYIFSSSHFSDCCLDLKFFSFGPMWQRGAIVGQCIIRYVMISSNRSLTLTSQRAATTTSIIHQIHQIYEEWSRAWSETETNINRNRNINRNINRNRNININRNINRNRNRNRKGTFIVVSRCTVLIFSFCTTCTVA